MTPVVESSNDPLGFNKKGCDHQVLQDNVLVEQVVKPHTSDPHTAGLDLLAIFSSARCRWGGGVMRSGVVVFFGGG